MITVAKAVSASTYPGRGILIGQSADGRHAVCAYFIMGRSENSQNRIFVTDGEGIRTEAHQPERMTDPGLIIYSPVRTYQDFTIVSNGDQTDTIYKHLSEEGTFHSALRTREYEPDAPNYTPRISGMIVRYTNTFRYRMSILKRAVGGSDACQRSFFEYDPVPGVGHFLHTYMGNGDPLPSFVGEPTAVSITEGLDQMKDTLWNNLNDEFKVSLFVRYIRLPYGGYEQRIVNKKEDDLPWSPIFR